MGKRVLGSLIARGELDALMACDHPHHETPKKFLIVSDAVFHHALLPTFAKEAQS